MYYEFRKNRRSSIFLWLWTSACCVPIIFINCAAANSATVIKPSSRQSSMLRINQKITHSILKIRSDTQAGSKCVAFHSWCYAAHTTYFVYHAASSPVIQTYFYTFVAVSKMKELPSTFNYAFGLDRAVARILTVPGKF